MASAACIAASVVEAFMAATFSDAENSGATLVDMISSADDY
jgi:hypothetical protein